MNTTARRRGEDWVLNGSKMWITNAPIADVAVDFVRVHFHVEIELATGSRAKDSRECRLLRQPDPGRHREHADLEIGRMANADVVSLRAVEEQGLAKLPFVRHRAVNQAVMCSGTVARLATIVVEFPMCDGCREVRGGSRGNEDEPETSRKAESAASTERTDGTHVG